MCNCNCCHNDYYIDYCDINYNKAHECNVYTKIKHTGYVFNGNEKNGYRKGDMLDANAVIDLLNKMLKAYTLSTNEITTKLASLQEYNTRELNQFKNEVLRDYIKKSTTKGHVMNDGTIDTTGF